MRLATGNLQVFEHGVNRGRSSCLTPKLRSAGRVCGGTAATEPREAFGVRRIPALCVSSSRHGAKAPEYGALQTLRALDCRSAFSLQRHSKNLGRNGKLLYIHTQGTLQSTGALATASRTAAPYSLFHLSLILAICLNLIAQTNLAATVDLAASARKTFQDAQIRYKKEPRNTEAAWQFARACFDLADLATNNAQRIEIAEKGIAACKQLLSRDLHSAPGHYYVGMNLGQVAQTRGLGAFKLVTEMEREFGAARDLDSSFDYGGPDRNLGLLYRDAPSMISIGSRTRAKKHLQRAVELAPNYPENRLNLIEAYLKWNDRNAAHNELKTLEELLPRARATFAGKAWEASWADWEERLRKIRKKVEEPSKAPSPRQKD